MEPNEHYPDFTLTYNGIKLIMTCRSVPEQYNAYDGRGREVGYVRLRGGRFTIDVPFGNTIHWAFFDDEWKGEFDDQVERELYLNDACERIKTELKKANNN